MRTTSFPNFPPVPKLDDAKAQRYLAELHRALIVWAQGVYEDLAQGKATLTAFSTLPTTAGVDENQVVVRTDGGNEALYVNVDGTMKSASLS